MEKTAQVTLTCYYFPLLVLLPFFSRGSTSVNMVADSLVTLVQSRKLQNKPMSVLQCRAYVIFFANRALVCFPLSCLSLLCVDVSPVPADRWRVRAY